MVDEKGRNLTGEELEEEAGDESLLVVDMVANVQSFMCKKITTRANCIQ